MNFWKSLNLISFFLLSSLLSATSQAGPSVFLTAPPDSLAVTLEALGDGIADDIDAIQQAIDAAATLMPRNFWNNGEFKDRYNPNTDHITTFDELFAEDVGMAKAQEYVSLDGSLVLPAFSVFQQGAPSYLGWRWSHALTPYGFVKTQPKQRVFVSNEPEGKVYSAEIAESGALNELQVFANQGRESVAVDDDGNVYAANGQVFEFDPNGNQIDLIKVPEGPLQIVIGGKDGRTLFMLSHHSLYAAKI